MKNVLIFLLLIMIISCKKDEFEPIPNQVSDLDTSNTWLAFDVWVNGPATWSPVIVANSGNVLHWDAWISTEIVASINGNDPTFKFDEGTFYVSFNVTSNDNFIGLTQLDLQLCDVMGVDISAAKSLKYLNVRECGLSEERVIEIVNVLIAYNKIDGYLNVTNQHPKIKYNPATLEKFKILTNRGWTVFY